MNHPPAIPRRLTRSRDDRFLTGVCGGFARYLGADAALIRILTAVLVVVTGGAALLPYIVAVLVMPQDEEAGPPPPGYLPSWPPQPPAAAPGPARDFPAYPDWDDQWAPPAPPHGGTPTPAPDPAASPPAPPSPPDSGR